MTEDLFREIGYVQKSNGELHLPSTSWRTNALFENRQKKRFANKGVQRGEKRISECLFLCVL